MATRTRARPLALVATTAPFPLTLFAGLSAAHADQCTRRGLDVICDDGRRGLFQGDAILWPDGTHSRLHGDDSVIIGNRASVVVGPGVFVGRGTGVVPMENPSAPNKLRCAVLDGVSYCD